MVFGTGLFRELTCRDVCLLLRLLWRWVAMSGAACQQQRHGIWYMVYGIMSGKGACSNLRKWMGESMD